MNIRSHPRTRAAMVVLGCLALGMTVAAAPIPTPLKGQFTGSGFTFSGNLSHLGLFTGQITSFIPTETGGLTTATWTAANGDEVFVSSVFTVTGYDSSTGLFTFSQEITIGGGTGRFAGASGEASAVGETAIDFSTYYGNINGVIDY